MRVDFVIVTALEEERDAVLSKLQGGRKLPPTEADVRVYFHAGVVRLISQSSSIRWQIELNLASVSAKARGRDQLRRCGKLENR
jgi:hypothetical protein